MELGHAEPAGHNAESAPAARVMTVFVKDVVTRSDEIKAKATSFFGDVLKLDSTKKVQK